MDGVIGKASLMKSVSIDVQEYGTDIILGVSVLEIRLERNVDVTASTGID